MNVALWIVTGLLALAFLAAGLTKITQPKAALAAKGMTYVDDFTAGQVKAIGAVEVLGAIGLIVPGVTDIAPVLVPIAATGLALMMIGAVVVHLRRKEAFLPALVLAVLAAAVAVLRFGSYQL